MRLLYLPSGFAIAPRQVRICTFCVDYYKDTGGHRKKGFWCMRNFESLRCYNSYDIVIPISILSPFPPEGLLSWKTYKKDIVLSFRQRLF